MAAGAPNWGFSPQEVAEFKEHFATFDTSGDGSIDAPELEAVLKALGEYNSAAQVRELIAEVDADKSGTIEFAEFLQIMRSVASGQGSGSQFVKVYEKQKKLIQVKGKSAGALHSFSQEEMDAFSEYFNQILEDDPYAQYLLPLGVGEVDLCRKVRDGVLLSRFIDKINPDLIHIGALNTKENKLSLFEINENQALMLASAQALGVQIASTGPGDLIHGEENPHLVLGLVWQLVKIHLMQKINLNMSPLIKNLATDGLDENALRRLPPEQLLLRWVNYQLEQAAAKDMFDAQYLKPISNFGSDVADSRAYAVLLARLDPAKNKELANAMLRDSDHKNRATNAIAGASNVGAKPFIKPADIVKGNTRLNLGFVASIFNACPGLEQEGQDPPEPTEAVKPQDLSGDDREELAFRTWINSLGLPGVHIQSLYHACTDGLVLLKVMDHIEPGIVNWSGVSLKPANRWAAGGNCTRVVDTAKVMGLRVDNTSGTNIQDADDKDDDKGSNKKLLLGLVWQLMRYHVVKFLSSLSSGGRKITDEQIIKWCNETAQKGGSARRMASTNDPSLSDSLFFLDVLNTLRPGIVGKDYVNEAPGDDPARRQNALYALSVARKLGAVVFLLPDDIVHPNSKMILTFCATMMHISQSV